MGASHLVGTTLVRFPNPHYVVDLQVSWRIGLVLPLSSPRVGGVKREWRCRRQQQDEWISWAKICHVGSICHWTISIYSKFSLILCITQVHIMVLWQCLQCKLYMHVLRPQNKKTANHAFESYAGMLVCWYAWHQMHVSQQPKLPFRIREASHIQNGWIFGKVPNGLWPPPPSF